MEQSSNDSNQDVQSHSCATKKSRWLTVVYRDLDTVEVQELLNHKNCSAIHDRDNYKALLRMSVQAKNTA